MGQNPVPQVTLKKPFQEVVIPTEKVPVRFWPIAILYQNSAIFEAHRLDLQPPSVVKTYGHPSLYFLKTRICLPET